MDRGWVDGLSGVGEARASGCAGLVVGQWAIVG